MWNDLPLPLDDFERALGPEAKKGYKTIKGKMGVFGWISRIALIVWTAVMIGWMVGAGT